MHGAVTVKFVDFWDCFDENDNKFLSALRSRYGVEVIPASSDEEPEILFYSRNGQKHLDYDSAIKVYYTGENDVPDFNECDYAISFHRLDFGKRHLRYPLYMMYEIDELKRPRYGVEDEGLAERPFCSFLMRNDWNCDPRRVEIVDAVEAYRPIAYGGPWRNNVGGPVDEKIPFISGYKFNLALENSRVEGYVTEKLLEPLVASTVPLYWGAPDAGMDFNPEAFVNIADYNSMDNFIADLKRIDNDNDSYMKILRAPKLLSDCETDFDDRLAGFLSVIVEERCRYAPRYGEAGDYHRRRVLLRPFGENRNLMRMAKLVSLCARGFSAFRGKKGGGAG